MFEEPRLVLDDLDTHEPLVLVVVTPHCLSETAFAQQLNDLKPILEMIISHQLIISLLVIVTTIKLLASFSLHFSLGVAHVEHLQIVARLQFLDFERGQLRLVMLQNLLIAHGKARRSVAQSGRGLWVGLILSWTGERRDVADSSRACVVG